MMMMMMIVVEVMVEVGEIKMFCFDGTGDNFDCGIDDQGGDEDISHYDAGSLFSPPFPLLQFGL